MEKKTIREVGTLLKLSEKTISKGELFFERYKEERKGFHITYAEEIGCLYGACIINYEKKYQREFNEITGISAVTFRKHYKDIMGYIGLWEGKV